MIKRLKLLLLTLTSIVFLVTIYGLWPLRQGSHNEYTKSITKPRFKDPNALTYGSMSSEFTRERLGYVTWLGKTGNGSDSEDVYFLATRVLVYQILHDPITRSPNNLPIIVMTTPDVSPANNARLTQDGAVVHPIDFITEGQSWLKPRRKTWRHIMAKLRAWELISFDRLLMLDNDMLLRRPLDGVFLEPSAQIASTRDPSTLPDFHLPEDESPIPRAYLLAGTPQVFSENHTYPPTREANDLMHPSTMNMGFCLLSPSLDLFHYYLSILRIPRRFNSATMEQSLLNYAHRRDGPVPWVDLPTTWTTTRPNLGGLVGQVASFHVKWWRPQMGYLPELEEWARGKKDEMLRFYEERDRGLEE
jgi:alpha-N-acetylglucosamine transferase